MPDKKQNFDRWLRRRLRRNPKSVRFIVPDGVAKHFPCSCVKGKFEWVGGGWNANEGHARQLWETVTFTIELRGETWVHTTCGQNWK